MYVVTGANGQLGRLVIEALLTSVAPQEIVAAVRNPGAAADLAGRGVEVRTADYDRPETLTSAFAGAERILLISSSEVNSRLPQHLAVIAAAQEASVKLLAYTSILHADTATAKLAREHRETEAALAASGLPVALLRNGWYTENYLMALHPALEHGAMIGAAGEGRISLAARADCAAAAAAVLTLQDQAGQIYELAGDEAWTLAAFAAEITRQSGRPMAYRDLPEAAYEAALVGAGLPPVMAGLLADADARAGEGALYDSAKALSGLIGRPTTPVPQTIATALKG